jgi:hypothetical protein
MSAFLSSSATNRLIVHAAANAQRACYTHIELSAYNLVTFPRVRAGAQAQSAVEGGQPSG